MKVLLIVLVRFLWSKKHAYNFCFADNMSDSILNMQYKSYKNELLGVTDVDYI